MPSRHVEARTKACPSNRQRTMTGTDGPLAWTSFGPYAVIFATISPCCTDNPAAS
jgi:hypothetical protein